MIDATQFERDLQVDVYRGADLTVRVLHRPTGIRAERRGARSELKARSECKAEVRAALQALTEGGDS